VAAPPQTHLARRLNGPGDGPPPLPASRPQPAAAAAPIALGPVARAHLARALEQSQGALLLCCVEAAGGDPGARWRLVLEQARLEPEG
jgi:hypothetical protein